MEPKTAEEQIAELEALIERMKADIAKSREALETGPDQKPLKPGNGHKGS